MSEQIETIETVGGNTNFPHLLQSKSKSTKNKAEDKPKQPNQLMHWCFTWNNYPVEAIERLETLLPDICKSFCFQEEVGDETGTPHLQGVISLKKAMRWTEFSPCSAIHWEKCVSVPASYKYCSKPETRKSGTKPHCLNYSVPKELKLITPSKPWQIEILELLKTEPDDRTVHWYWSQAGGIGKSSFAKYLVIKENCLFFEEGKKADIMNLIFTAPDDRLEKIVIDIPRDNGNAVSYKSIESIKNGLIYSSKYEGGYKYFNSPHIIVFANKPPDEARLSADRWHIVNIDEGWIEEE